MLASLCLFPSSAINVSAAGTGPEKKIITGCLENAIEKAQNTVTPSDWRKEGQSSVAKKKEEALSFNFHEACRNAQSLQERMLNFYIIPENPQQRAP